MKLRQIKKVRFDELTHTYLLTSSGAFLEGVTTMLKAQGLAADYTGIKPHVLAHAAARGTAIHEMLREFDDKGQALTARAYSWLGADSEMEDETSDFEAELKTYSALALNVIASEYLVSDFKTVASSIDKVVLVDENTVDLGDVKTTSQFHSQSVAWQLSVYAYLFEKQNPKIKVRNLFGIWVRDGKTQIRPVSRFPNEAIELLLQCEALRLAEAAKTGVDVKGDFLEQWHPESSMEEALVVTDELVASELKLAELTASVKILEAAVKEQRTALYEYMLREGKDMIETESGTFKLKRPYMTRRVDSDKLKKDGLYEKYTNSSEVKGSISFTPNNNS